MEIDLDAGAPPFATDCSICGHRRTVCRHTLAVKRWLSKPALAEMVFALACQEALAEQVLRALEAAALVEVLVVRDEDVADEIRMAEQIQRFGA